MLWKLTVGQECSNITMEVIVVKYLIKGDEKIKNLKLIAA